MTGLWVALAAIVVALLIGGYRSLTDGRFRGTHAVRGAAAGVGPLDTPDEAPGVNGLDTPALEESGHPTDEAPEVAGRVASAAERSETTWAELAGATAGTRPGERATLVQFSSAFCAPCRVTRRVLADVADSAEGVTHLEIDAEHHLDVVRRLGVLRTPTTLVLDGTGREVARATGAPRREQVLAALPALLDPKH